MPPSQYDIIAIILACLMTIIEAVIRHVEFSFLPLAEKKEIVIFLPGDN